MSNKSKEALNSVLMLLALIVITFVAVVGYVTWIDLLPVEYEGLFANLLLGIDNIMDNPLFVSWITTAFVNIFGWLENYTQTGEPWDRKRFFEAWMLYIPLLAILTQWLPTPYAMVLALVLDIARRIATRLSKNQQP